MRSPHTAREARWYYIKVHLLRDLSGDDTAGWARNTIVF